MHRHLVTEFILRLTKRRLVLKMVEQQLELAAQILASSNLIQNFCTQNVSLALPIPTTLSISWHPALPPPPQPCLCPQGSHAEWLQQALPSLAEIIRLQDLNAIKISVATYATYYPDFR